ncbi:hypothetical protein F4808DRAFT_107570 [Astrocystis sublimbata]|nr:hypothetical protein F4808DRAFT_107570 [Astrocystis sublimbata]
MSVLEAPNGTRLLHQPTGCPGPSGNVASIPTSSNRREVHDFVMRACSPSNLAVSRLHWHYLPEAAAIRELCRQVSAFVTHSLILPARVLFLVRRWKVITVNVSCMREHERLGRWTNPAFPQGKSPDIANQRWYAPTELCRMPCSREYALHIVGIGWLAYLGVASSISSPVFTQRQRLHNMRSRAGCHLALSWNGNQGSLESSLFCITSATLSRSSQLYLIVA